MTGYVRKFEGNTTMHFKISSKQLLKKYIQIWKWVEKLLKIGFYSKPVYGDNNKYIKTKIKIYAGNMITNVQGKNVPCKCLLIIMLDSVIKTKKKYYPKIRLEECKYEQEEIKVENIIDDDLEKTLSDEPDNGSNDETEFDNYESNK